MTKRLHFIFDFNFCEDKDYLYVSVFWRRCWNGYRRY